MTLVSDWIRCGTDDANSIRVCKGTQMQDELLSPGAVHAVCC